MKDAFRPMVVKIGGSMAEDRQALTQLAADLAKHATRSGAPTLLVHGGGKDISRNLVWLGQEARFVDGLRVTDEAAMDIVEMTLSGRVNKMLVRLLLHAGARACGISGVDGGLLRTAPLRPDGSLGRVGRVESVEPALLHTLWSNGWLPVVSPVGLGSDNGPWNVNADDAAAALAAATSASALVYVSDVPGVLREGSLISSLGVDEVEDLIGQGVATGGMIPKLRSCADTVRHGVDQVIIAGWSGAGALERILSSQEGTRLHAC